MKVATFVKKRSIFVCPQQLALAVLLRNQRRQARLYTEACAHFAENRVRIWADSFPLHFACNMGLG